MCVCVCVCLWVHLESVQGLASPLILTLQVRGGEVDVKQSGKE